MPKKSEDKREVSLREIPRPEYPRPQLVREDWVNLNGPWTFCLDNARSGSERNFAKAAQFDNTILVPFAPESSLSGVDHKDFIESMWYQRRIKPPAEWEGRRIMLNFGGVDYECEVYVDGNFVGRHFGGSSAFSMDISAFAQPGEWHNLVVHVRDDLRTMTQTGGKQSHLFHSSGCLYTRTTGIWQTVWMEAVHRYSLTRCQIIPGLDSGTFTFVPEFLEVSPGNVLRIRISDEQGDEVGAAEQAADQGVPINVKLTRIRPWSTDVPHLYSMTLEVLGADNEVLDRVTSYSGLRKIHCAGNEMFLNNEPLYLRLVLDQGYFMDGIWTAPSEDALRTDIELSLAAGFNGARLHQKVFEERFHYLADKMGYLTWCESASWGLDVKSDTGHRNFLNEWRDIVLQSRNHPSIIAWTTLNETWDVSNPRQHKRLHVEAYDLTRSLDPTRPINNASGGCHVKTDLYTVHNYEQNPELLRKHLTVSEDGDVWKTLGEKEVKYEGQPYLVDEFGGIKWIPSKEQEFTPEAWGYGEPPKTIEEFYSRLEGQVDALLALSHVCGYCYTQLTDVEQEQNGLYNYDRSDKFDRERIARIFSKVPESYNEKKG